jgi:quercetin dioxygenase-like cupin family protein
MRRLCLLSLALAALSTVAIAQDPVKVDPAHYKVILDNASVRVLNVTYPVGGKSVMHQHPDSIAVALAPSSVRFDMPDGKSQDSEMANESALYIPAGSHSPANIGKAATRVIVIEFKAAKPGTATLPDTRQGIGMKPLAEGPRAVAYRATTAADFAEAAGSRHDFDQVVIALGPTQVSLSIDGKPAKTTWARGDAQFIGRGVPHEAKNTGGKPVDMIIVAIK